MLELLDNSVSIACLIMSSTAERLPLWEHHNWLSKYDLKRFAGRFPSYMGLIWFSLGLGGEILRTWKGNTISDPLPLISSEKMRVSES